jgi:hypothetical protein
MDPAPAPAPDPSLYQMPTITNFRSFVGNSRLLAKGITKNSVDPFLTTGFNMKNDNRLENSAE